ncbi:MAG: family 1 glycosylhydrolase [Candidatus Limnocylindrales bacterium]|jgi:beta-glucosidase
MTALAFPAGFLWGTATAAHQVEGGNSNSDWWEWELKPGAPCKEPSGAAIDHYTRYGRDAEMLAGLGFNTYRFSVEWARIEPSEGVFDEAQVGHYRDMVAAVRNSGLVPMVTLNHFTLPIWVAKLGGWLAEATPALFERYVRRVVEALGESVDWYCTINEPGVVAFGGYMGALGFPPGTHGLANWKRAARGLIEGHRRARAAVKELRPDAQVGQTHSMQEWESNAGGRPAMEFARRMGEDIYLEASNDDDFVGVQTYTRARLDMPRPVGWLTKAALAVDPIERLVVSRTVGRQTGGNPTVDARDGIRRTQMGYEFRPQAVAATVRRAAQLLPGKPIVVTEHGIATADDAERVEFITEGLKALHEVLDEGIPLRGYIHWSAFDNFEWALGYAMQFGLVAVDRVTQERTPRPSARFLGAIARANYLELADPR